MLCIRSSLTVKSDSSCLIRYLYRFNDVVARLQEKYDCLRDALTERNYVARWDLLIHLEDLENMVNISRYNQHASLHRVQVCVPLTLL